MRLFCWLPPHWVCDRAGAVHFALLGRAPDPATSTHLLTAINISTAYKALICIGPGFGDLFWRGGTFCYF